MKNLQFDLNSANSQLEILTLERDELESCVTKQIKKLKLKMKN